MNYKHDVDKLIEAGWIPSIKRPTDGALVAYLFGPFSSIYVGYYDAESDAVCGNSGFTTWCPEVLCWCPLPW